MDNLLEVCTEMGLKVEYLSLKERGAFATPMKEIIRAFNMSEDDPGTVTIVLDKDDISNMKMSATLHNRRHTGESVLRAPLEEENSADVGLIFCNGVVHTWDYVKSTAEWKSFFQHCAATEEWLCNICDTPDVLVTQVVSCRTCCKWLCKTCAEKLTVNKCPSCNSMRMLWIINLNQSCWEPRLPQLLPI